VPAGLVPVTHLPDLGAIGVFLAARRGLDVDVEAAGLSALEVFFGGLRDASGSPMVPVHASSLELRTAGSYASEVITDARDGR
jgi:hypothetical protein